MTALRPLSVALVLSILAVSYLTLTGTPSRPAPPRPAVERAPSSGAITPPDTASALLAAPLLLQPVQRQRLERLAAAWRHEAAPLEEAVAAARAEVEMFMRDATARGGASASALQARSADFRELSARLRERRAAHRAAALEILTPEQRAALSTAPLTAGGAR